MANRAAAPAPRAAKAGAERALRNASTARPAYLAPSSVCKADLASPTTAIPVHMHHAVAPNTRSRKRRPTRSPARATQVLHARAARSVLSSQEGWVVLTLEGTARFGFRGGGKAGAAPRPHQNAAYSSMMQCYTPFSLQNPLAGETTDSSTTVILHEPTRMRQETYYTML